MKRLVRIWKSSVGAKAVMALTGFLLLLFVIFHLLGNLQLYRGRQATNDYAALLKGLGPWLWLARLGLLVVFGVHVAAGFRLNRRNRAARPQPYAYDALAQDNGADQLRVRLAIWMLLSGLLILLFVAYHLLHFTFGWIGGEAFSSQDELGRHDVYSMVILGFQNPLVAMSYVAFMLALGAHLFHGTGSMLQSVGINHPAYNRPLRAAAAAVGLLIVIGNCAMPLGVLLFDYPSLTGP